MSLRAAPGSTGSLAPARWCAQSPVPPPPASLGLEAAAPVRPRSRQIALLAAASRGATEERSFHCPASNHRRAIAARRGAAVAGPGTLMWPLPGRVLRRLHSAAAPQSRYRCVAQTSAAARQNPSSPEGHRRARVCSASGTDDWLGSSRAASSDEGVHG